MVLRTDHTRANQERPPTTPIADPEKIIGIGRALQRKTSKAARTSRSGILRVESVLQDLFVEGEENLALLLGNIYKDFYFLDPYEFNKSPLGRTWLIKDEEAEFKIQIPVHQFTLGSVVIFYHLFYTFPFTC